MGLEGFVGGEIIGVVLRKMGRFGFREKEKIK